MVDSPRPDSTSPDPTRALRLQLEQAQAAASRAETQAGEYEAKLRATSDERDAALAAQAEWDELLGHIERERVVAAQVAAELAAVKSSTSWKVIWAVLGPYRRITNRG